MVRIALCVWGGGVQIPETQIDGLISQLNDKQIKIFLMTFLLQVRSVYRGISACKRGCNFTYEGLLFG